MRLKLFCVAAVILSGATSAESIAQETWGGFSSSCDRRGGCHLDSRDYQHDYRADSIELIPYGTASRQSYRPPARNGLGYDSAYSLSRYAGCEGGVCSERQYNSQYASSYYGQETGSDSCLNGQCRHDSAAYENEFDDRRSSPDAYGQNRRPEYRSNNDSNFNSYASPNQRPQRWHDASPADRRPDLNRPGIAPRTNFAPNNFRSESNNSQLVPLTPTQIIPPPKLPPQPSANLNQRDPQGSRFESIPQLLPPTSVGKSQPQRRG